MSKFQVTLADLRKHGACVSGYNKVVRMIQGQAFTDADSERETHIRFKHDAPILLADIARNNGLDDALWTLRCIQGIDRDARLFAVWCARQVQHLMTENQSIAALDVAELHANGNATDKELAAAWDAARAAASAAAWDAASDAACAAARAAASAAAWAAASAAAWDAARAAASAAAWDAASDAACAAARAAASAAAWAAASAAARAAAWVAQLEMLIAVCEGRTPWQVEVNHAE